jgi:HEAT repeat protein
MTIKIFKGQANASWIAMAALLAIPAISRAHAVATQAPVTAETWQDAQDQDQDARDREQAKRDREQEARDREQEKRDREQEKLDRVRELYDNGREDLDEERYEKAAAKFKALADMNGPQTDAALYWSAYADNRLGKRDAALAAIADLKRRFPQSRWQKDASALEIEVRQSTGQRVPVAEDSDCELKIMAIQGLMNSNLDQGLPLLQKVLNGSACPKAKSKALFVLAQNGSPQSRDILGQLAKGQGNPELQRKAVEYLGLFGGKEALKTLGEVYASTNDEDVKRRIIRSYMLAHAKDLLFTAAKTEKNESLRREAIRNLGLVQGTAELEQLYQAESSTDLRREILQAFFLAGDSGRLVKAAQGEKDPELRRAAIRNLGLINSPESANALQEIYSKETDHSLKAEVLNAYFLQNNAHALVQVAKTEKDPELKKTAVSKLSQMNSKEGTEYLMELLQK